MKNLLKRFLPFMLVVILLSSYTLAFAADIQEPDFWAVSELVDAESLNLLPENWNEVIQSPVSPQQSRFILTQVDDNISILGYEKVRDLDLSAAVSSRGEFLELLYSILSAYPDFTDNQQEMVKFMAGAGILKGTLSGDLLLDKPCSLQDALIFSARTISYIYNVTGQASNGLLWKATNGGNTLYLLGTIHVDRGNVYPFSDNLMSAINQSQEAIFEIDFMNQDGIEYYVANTVYTDGSTLKDHIPPELYEMVAGLYAQFGVSEDEIALYRPWVLASQLSNLALYYDDSAVSLESVMPIDSYIYSKAMTGNLTISEIEGYAYQVDMFNNLSDETQSEYLLSAASELYAVMSGEGTAASIDKIDVMLQTWKGRDIDGFNAAYEKDASLATADEFTDALYTLRDENMTEYAVRLLNAEGTNTFIIVVGAGHMVGTTGIVNRLTELGYSVGLVPVG